MEDRDQTRKSLEDHEAVPDPREMEVLVGLFSAGRFCEAESLARWMTLRFPDHGFVWRALGVVLQHLGRLDEAIVPLQKAIGISPYDADAYNSLGNIYSLQGEHSIAEEKLRKALKIRPDDADIRINLGATLYDLGRLEDAVEIYRGALQISPEHALAHYNMGNALRALGRLKEAEQSYLNVLKFNPEYAEAHYNRAINLSDMGRILEAEASYLNALKIRPDHAEAHNNLGILLMKMRRIEEAEASYRRALKIRPDYAEAHNNIGFPLLNMSRMDEAEASYRRAIDLKPDYAEAYFNLGMLLLSLGRYAEGWPYYEFRADPRTKARRIPDLPFPQWMGEPLVGKTLLVYPEQGLGDTIQFSRYVPWLKKLGVARLTLACTIHLEALLKTLEGVDEVVTEIISPYDFWISPLSLPLYFGTTLESIPANIPYLHALPERLEKWRLPANGFKVGLVWKGSRGHGNDKNRSLPGFIALAPLWAVPGISFYSLQKGQGEEEVMNPPSGLPIVHLGSAIEDFADTAAVIAQLDLLICVDTSIAHLAGAMGKPCWVLLPYINTDWRWLRKREDSPWYPGMRLFRQQEAGNWDQPVRRMRHALSGLISRD